jgi:hypothetical protein
MTIRTPLSVALFMLLVDARALAASKDECIEAHGRGQDLRDKGLLSRARQAFTTCAQSSCPSVVQADCARLNEDLSHLVPTATFVARDASATDLPSTSVYVDDVLVASRLDDGKSYEIDPGKHVLRYVHDGRETTMKVVLNQGEKGRVLIATLPSSSPPLRPPPEAFEPVVESRRSALPLVVAGVGAAAAVTGGVLIGLGLSRVPSSCSTSTKECLAAPGAPALEEAKSGVSLANTGIGIGITGAAFLVGGLVWYLLQPSSERKSFDAQPAQGGRAPTDMESRRSPLSAPIGITF